MIMSSTASFDILLQWALHDNLILTGMHFQVASNRNAMSTCPVRSSTICPDSQCNMHWHM